jgi:hypothetical protein
MVKVSVEFIQALRKAADVFEQSSDYAWQHMNVIDEMLAFGFTIDDLKHLEQLSDAAILSSLPVEERNLHRLTKHDVVKYIRTWATLLENQLLNDIYLPQNIINTETIL